VASGSGAAAGSDAGAGAGAGAAAARRADERRLRDDFDVREPFGEVVAPVKPTARRTRARD
jgi:hypothetical protein